MRPTEAQHKEKTHSGTKPKNKPPKKKKNCSWLLRSTLQVASTGAAKRLRDNEEKGEANKKHGPKSAASLLISSKISVLNGALVGLGACFLSLLAPSSFRTLRGLGCLTIILAHFLISLSFAWASSYNYPGSAALEIVHNEARSDVRCPGTLRVFIDDYAAMSGINRFQQLQDEKLSQCQSSTHFLYEKNC